MKRKTLDSVELKQNDDGEYTGAISAVIATFNTVDHDGDVVVPGAFTDGQRVRLSAYNHASWAPGHLPVGKGEIRTTETEARFHGNFFLGSTSGRDTFEVVKQMGSELQEYSWGYDVIEADQGQVDGENVQFLRKVEVHEVSPVLLGASIGTRTLGVKAKQMESELVERLREAGRERFGGADVYVYLADFELDEGWAVFNVHTETDGGERLVRVSYLRGAGGEVALGTEEIEVEREVTYEPKAPAPADDFAAMRARAAALTGAKAAELPEPREDEGLRDYDARLEVEAVKLAIPADRAQEPEPGQQKLSDQLASVTAEVEEVTARVAATAATREEKGKELGEASSEAAATLEAATKTLREVLASAAADDDDNADAWGEGLEIEDQLLRAGL